MNPSAQAFIPKTKTKSKLQDPDGPTRLSAAAPPFVPPSNKTGGNSPVSVTTPPHGRHADPEPAAPPLLAQASSVATAAAAKLPAAPSAVGGEERKREGEAPSPLDALDSAAEQTALQLAEVPAADPADWAESKLPVLFGCHNTKAKATSEPIRLHTAWDLYADDHGAANSPGVGTPLMGGGPGPGGAPGANPFEPVLVSTISDVETFWRLWRHLPAPSVCPVPFTYSWFRQGIEPEWEHHRNKRGGVITVVVFDRDKPGLNSKQILDDVWMATLVGCAGESFAETATTLNGVMLRVRPNNRPVTMQLWTAHSDLTKLRAFANSFRDAIGKVMGVKSLQKLEYYSHNQTMKDVGTLASRLKVKPKVTPEYTF